MLRWGVLLPTFDPLRQGAFARLLDAARRAEELGFDAAWAGDHLHCPAPVLDAPTCLAAAAAVTTRVSLGLSVMLVGLRAPAWAAKQLSTVDFLSGGRLLLGVGVGGEYPEEFAAAGVPVSKRGKRVDETLAVLPDLLAGRPVQYAGHTLTLDVPALEPAATPTPIYVGGRGEPALRRAAEFADTWLPMWLSPKVLAERRDRLAELAAERGRERPRLALLACVHIGDDPIARRAQAEAYLGGQYGLPLNVVERWTLLGSAQEVAERLAAYRAEGVEELVLMPLASDTLRQYERLAEVRQLVCASSWTPSLAGAGAPSGLTSTEASSSHTGNGSSSTLAGSPAPDGTPDRQP